MEDRRSGAWRRHPRAPLPPGKLGSRGSQPAAAGGKPGTTRGLTVGVHEGCRPPVAAARAGGRADWSRGRARPGRDRADNGAGDPAGERDGHGRARHRGRRTSAFVALAAVLAGRAVVAWAQEVAAHRAAAAVKTELRGRLGWPSWPGSAPPGCTANATGELTTVATRGLDALDAYFARYLPQVVGRTLVPLAVIAAVLPADLVAGLTLLVTTVHADPGSSWPWSARPLRSTVDASSTGWSPVGPPLRGTGGPDCPRSRRSAGPGPRRPRWRR